MSKIRIYELAKELGVDNKVVITLAQELGFKGKSSHSHSLEWDEADQIKRAVLRDSVNREDLTTGTEAANVSSRIDSGVVVRRSAKMVDAPQPAEVVTTRIDNSSGTSEAVVEKRRGDLIMRRRSVAPQEAPQKIVEPISTPTVIAVNQSKNESIDSDLFKDKTLDGAPSPDFDIEDEKIIKSNQEKRIEEDLEENQAVNLSDKESAQKEKSQHASSKQVSKSQVTRKPEPVQVIEEVKEEVIDPKYSPKVLGKIELPVARSKATADIKKLGTFSKAVDTDAEELKKSKLGKVKSKKREISRGDLVDYDSREFRRPGSKSGKTQRENIKDQNESTQTYETRVPVVVKRTVKLGDAITVGDLARQMSLKSGEVISKLIQLGVMATINQLIDKDTATLIAEEFGAEIESTSVDETHFFMDEPEDNDVTLITRPPVVTVMGHVDHGKTSLLDKIRQAAVADKEAGGITQHIGAYQVKLPSGKFITFIDTPGHAAFTAMRARGAKVTDIVILVVAADDGVMPQTLEAISHAKAAEVPIVVAVNKMDKPQSNPDRVKQQLSEHGLQPEDWGGQTMFFGVSALKGTGINELLDGVILQAEVMELKANPDRKAKGTIIESRQDKGRGNVSTVLVQKGTLRIGDVFVAGPVAGKIRSMNDYSGTKIIEATPSTPVEITGLSSIPSAGDDFIVVESEVKARQIAEMRAEKIAIEERILAGGPISLEEFAKRANSPEVAELNVIVKADVNGSLEAVRSSLEQSSTEKVRVKVIHSAVGGINESDIQLAVASRAIIVGFGVRAEPRAMSDAERYKIDVRFYRVIYELIDDIKKAMAGLLEPIKQEVFLGRAEVRDTFTVPKIGVIAGSYVIDGSIKRGKFTRVLRDSRVIYEGKIGSLRRFKDDAKEVQTGYECGIGVENFNDIKVGDILEVFEIEEIAATL